jgi:hypothetical protein
MMANAGATSAGFPLLMGRLRLDSAQHYSFFSFFFSLPNLEIYRNSRKTIKSWDLFFQTPKFM